MKQLRHSIRFRVNSGQVRTFVQIAVNAGEDKIVGFISAAMNLWENVFDVECRQRGIILMQLAILAAIAGSLPHQRSQARTHRLRRGLDPLAGLSLQNGDEFVRAHVTGVFSLLLLGELAFSGLASQLLDPRLKLGIGAKPHHRRRFLRQNDLEQGANSPLERGCFCCSSHAATLARWAVVATLETLPFRFGNSQFHA
jgi:hypothetical protein